jgi:hypothetical protein
LHAFVGKILFWIPKPQYQGIYRVSSTKNVAARLYRDVAKQLDIASIDYRAIISGRHHGASATLPTVRAACVNPRRDSSRYPRYLSVAIELASDKIAVITIIPKATSSIK